jgi:hypothetical protein
MKKNFFVSLIERVGLLCLLIAAVYGGWLYFRSGQLVVEPELPAISSDIELDAAVYNEWTVEEFVFPEEGRDIFSHVTPVAVSSPPESKNMPSSLPGRFRLAGVVVDSFPQIVVEDLPAGKTYFISEGRQEGGLSVLSISTEQVQLEYMGQQYRITLEGAQ